MNNEQRVGILRELLEEAAFVVMECENYVVWTDRNSPGRYDLLKRIGTFKSRMQSSFTPQVINAD